MPALGRQKTSVGSASEDILPGGGVYSLRQQDCLAGCKRMKINPVAQTPSVLG